MGPGRLGRRLDGDGDGEAHRRRLSSSWPRCLARAPATLHARISALVLRPPCCGLLNGAEAEAWEGAPPTPMILGDALRHTRDPGALILTVAAAGALAGSIIQAAYRQSVIAGALVAMRLIEAASVTGIALALGRLDLVGEGLERLAIDMGLIVAAGLVVFGLKQLLVHRRAPLR